MVSKHTHNTQIQKHELIHTYRYPDTYIHTHTHTHTHTHKYIHMHTTHKDARKWDNVNKKKDLSKYTSQKKWKWNELTVKKKKEKK